MKAEEGNKPTGLFIDMLCDDDNLPEFWNKDVKKGEKCL